MGIVSDILDTGKNKDTNKKDKEKEVYFLLFYFTRNNMRETLYFMTSLA